MPDDSLISEAQPDRFTSESPIRAFTEFRVAGTWAIGKGFRPSLAHMHTYLDAMQRKEGWHLVQMLQGETFDPTLIFQRDRVMAFTVPTGSDAVRLPAGEDSIVAHGERVNVIHGPILDADPDSPIFAAFDTAINPAHYNGTACAEIGELLTANSFQVLKYNWRLGEKNNPCEEIGKSLWYLDREIALAEGNRAMVPRMLPEHGWFDERLRHATQHAQAVARILISWNRHGNAASLRGLRKNLQRDLDDRNGCQGWGRGLEP